MKRSDYKIIFGVMILLVSLAILIVLLGNGKIVRSNPEKDDLKKFENCVGSSNLILYGSSNSKAFLIQQDELGDFFDLVPFVDCSTNRKDCEGVFLIPAWRIDEQLYYGSISLDILIKLMECE